MEKNESLICLGKAIRDFRKKENLSQLEFSLVAGISKSYLAELELGRMNPTFLMLKKISSALGISLFELLSFCIED